MVEEKQLSGMIDQFKPADGSMIDSRMAGNSQVEVQIMGEYRANDVAMGHEDIGPILRALHHGFYRSHCTVLHFPQRLSAGWTRQIRLRVPVSLRGIIREILPIAIDPVADADLAQSRKTL